MGNEGFKDFIDTIRALEGETLASRSPLRHLQDVANEWHLPVEYVKLCPSGHAYNCREYDFCPTCERKSGR